MLKMDEFKNINTQKWEFNGQIDYTIAVVAACLRIQDKDGNVEYRDFPSDKMKSLCEDFKKELEFVGVSYATYIENNKFIIALKDIDEKSTVPLMQKFQKEIEKYLNYDEVTFIGIGGTAKDKDSVFKSYTMAYKSAGLARIEYKEDECIAYSDLGIDKLLFNVEDVSCLEDYYNEYIKPLEEYDMSSGSNLVDTLECYMKHDGSTLDTALEMLVHSNTVKVKLKKIETILKLDITSFEARTKLAVGLLVANVRKIYLV